MATLGELREDLRATKLVEAPTDFYGDVTLLRWLEDASREIAAAFRFPRLDESQSVPAGTTEVGLSVTPLDVMSVSFDGIGLARRNFAYVRFYQQLLSERWPRAWYFEAFAGGPIQVGPANANAGEYAVHFVGPAYASTVTGNTEVWDGLFENFHELVLLRAAVKAFEKGFEFDESMHYLARYQQQLQEFAQFMGISAPPVSLRGAEDPG